MSLLSLPSVEEPGIFETIDDLSAARRARAGEQEVRRMREYAELMPTGRGTPLDLAPESFGFQIEPLYSDALADAEEVVLIKSSQAGGSEGLLRWMYRRVDVFGDTGLYIFPTDKHVSDFGDQRIEPVIENSEYLSSRIPRHYVKHKTLKRIGAGFLYLRGSNSRAGAQSVDGDAIVFDEYEELDPSNLPQIEQRLQGSRQAGRVPRVRRIGTPKEPGVGIDAAYQASDQREWHVDCSKCGTTQTISFFENLRWTTAKGGPRKVCRSGADHFDDPKDVVQAWRACRACDARLDVVDGRWIAKNPGAITPGYHLNRLAIPRADLREVVVASRKTQPAEVETFYNNVLGVAYESGEYGLTEEAIRAAAAKGRDPVGAYDGPNFTTAGVDMAGDRPMNVRIDEQLPDGRRSALWIGEITDMELLRQKLEAMRVAVVAVDANPERKASRALSRILPGRVHLIEYADKDTAPPIEFVKARKVWRVHRTDAIDAMMDAIRNGRSFPTRILPEGYVEQMRGERRRTVLRPNGQTTHRYVKVGPNDYLHADTYAVVATEILRARIRAGAIAGQEEQITRQRGGLDRPSMDYYAGFGERQE